MCLLLQDNEGMPAECVDMDVADKTSPRLRCLDLTSTALFVSDRSIQKCQGECVTHVPPDRLQRDDLHGHTRVELGWT